MPEQTSEQTDATQTLDVDLAFDAATLAYSKEKYRDESVEGKHVLSTPLGTKILNDQEELLTPRPDSLTGLLLRGDWETKTIELLEQFDRLDGPNNFFVLTIMDVDYLKQINDMHGHPAGDVVLKKIGNRSKKYFRKTDILGRYGGDENVQAGLAGTTTKHEILKRFEEIRNNIMTDPDNPDPSKQEITVTQSWGLAILTAEELHNIMLDSSIERGSQEYFEELLTRIYKVADKALYQAKDAGRNCLRSNQQP